MRFSTFIFIGFLLMCVFLLGILALRLASRFRQQQRALGELSDALNDSREEAERQKIRLAKQTDLDHLKNEFISTVSHELRTPLTSIRGALGLLSSGLLGKVDGKSQNLLRIASTNAERLIRLINDILDLERMESGRAPVSLRRCSLFDLAREAVDTMTAMADAAHIHMALRCHAAPEAIFFDADPDRILQVLTNLLSNAIKFSVAETTVLVEIDAGADSLMLKVVDHGRGVPADKLESIFNRFQQVESSDASKKGGTGLGLAICRSIILQHGGVIWAQPNQVGTESDQTAAQRNDVTSGTTFYVQFSRSARAGDTALPSTIPLLPGRVGDLILICDDDPSIRMVVSELLNRHGYDVIKASSGEEVIALAHEKTMRDTTTPTISTILLDLYLPGLGGWETLRQLKSSPKTMDLPVIILSVVPPSEQMLISGEVQGWVQKPFNENLLLAELERVLHPVEEGGHASQDERRTTHSTV
jgi:signal transduction histidine kinase/CheY-like chemotaxis protein